MAFRLICLLILISCTVPSHQISKLEDAYYVAGVVEFEPAAMNQSSVDQVNDNLSGYLDILTSPEAEEADIIVFPELTLNNVLTMTFVPDPERAVVPCENSVYQPFFQELSCTAKDVEKYVVVNVLEKETCTEDSQYEKNDPRDCAPNGLNTFNTNVVFDRNGTVVARYRKYHVYGEPRNTTYIPELSTFMTDFGVEFGLFICFDINFYSPAMDLVKSRVRDLIFTSFWYSELPFLTAVQLQQAWAYANNVNLLAAGASYPSIGSTGSGIYAGEQGALVSVMTGTPERKLYVANVPKLADQLKTDEQIRALPVNREVPQRRSPNQIKLMQEYKMPEFSSMLVELEPDENEVHERVCHNEFCCNFFLDVTKLYPPSGTSSYEYRMAAYEGDRQYSGHGYTQYKMCAIYACTNTSQASCGLVFDDSVSISPEYIFNYITIQASFPIAEQSLFMPNSLDQNLYPLPVEYSEFEKKNIEKGYTRIKYIYKNETGKLLTFGIYANYYNGVTSYHLLSVTCLIVSVLVAIMVGTCSL